MTFKESPRLIYAQSEPNEQQLFHGASSDSLAKILRQGFNRSYAGAHGACYGLGVYFARSAGYSCRYAPPDTLGHRRMLLCDVLVGEAALGNSSMRAPPPRGGGRDPHELCDSTVDSLLQPSIFVCYHDDQARTSSRPPPPPIFVPSFPRPPRPAPPRTRQRTAHIYNII